MNILQYESKVWSTADLLRGCGIKESEWPSFMMPFFALAMIESRLIRMLDDMKEEIGKEAFDNIDKDDLIELIQDKGQGYNIYIFEQNKRLADVCRNDKSFEIDFEAYLKGFDGETKDLLGVDPGDGDKYLDIRGIITKLKAKKVLFAYTKVWSEIDLKPFNNSEITTLEEHIKRKWADISAETAGEQYTPDDVISLISEIIASKIEDSDKLLKIYDCSCGGGNMLFGVEEKNGKAKRPVKSGRVIARRYRNRRIGEMLKELSLTEGRGTGIPAIYNAIAENGSPQPRFNTDDPDRRFFFVAFDEVPKEVVSKNKGGQVTGQVEQVLFHCQKDSSRKEMMNSFKLKGRDSFENLYLQPALKQGLIEMTQPDSPKSPTQKYRLTSAGKAVLQRLEESEDIIDNG